MPTVIIPVGLGMGPHYRFVVPPDPEPENFEVHLGSEMKHLTDAEVKVWAAAFANVDAHNKLEVNRASMVKALSRKRGGVVDAGRLIDKLLADGLLVEYDPLDGPIEQLLRGHRLCPLGQGIGATPEQPDMYRIGHNAQPVIAVQSSIYNLWSYSLTLPNLWEACEYLEEGHREAEAAGEVEPLHTSVELLAREISAALPLLIASTCAFLDPISTL